MNDKKRGSGRARQSLPFNAAGIVAIFKLAPNSFKNVFINIVGGFPFFCVLPRAPHVRLRAAYVMHSCMRQTPGAIKAHPLLLHLPLHSH